MPHQGQGPQQPGLPINSGGNDPNRAAALNALQAGPQNQPRAITGQGAPQSITGQAGGGNLVASLAAQLIDAFIKDPSPASIDAIQGMLATLQQIGQQPQPQGTQPGVTGSGLPQATAGAAPQPGFPG